ncbi:MAG: hypothetical protein ABIQ61_10525 [Ornithinibacter sp.]
MTGDRELRDEALEGEIELVSELVLAAAVSEEPLRQEQIDELLGVAPLGRKPAAAPPQAAPEIRCAPPARFEPGGPNL